MTSQKLIEKYYNENYGTAIIKVVSNSPTKFTQNINGKTIVVYIHYNWTMDDWIIDFYELLSDNSESPLITGLLLVPYLNLLISRAYLQLGEFYIVPLTQQKDEIPSYNDLSQQFQIFWRY